MICWYNKTFYTVLLQHDNNILIIVAVTGNSSDVQTIYYVSVILTVK